MSLLSTWLERLHGGPVARYEAEMARVERLGLRELRRRLVGDVSGRVLEVGCGTGLNFPHYAPGAGVTAIEPYAPFRRRAEERAREAAARISVRDGDAQALTFGDGQFDAALATLVFCTVPDALRGLREVRRVVRPGGEVRLLEHVRSERPVVAVAQGALDPLWRFCDGRGCNLNRDTVGVVKEAGLTVAHLEAQVLPAPFAWLFPLRLVIARA